MSNDFYIHKEYPKTCDPKDFFGQVKRTVNGQPVPEEQILMIVEQIRKSLSLGENDFVIDFGCGNAALASYFFEEIKGYKGVDFSDYLIEVANSNFKREGFSEFVVADVLDYLSGCDVDGQVTKALCYGAYSYFSKEACGDILRLIKQKYPNLKSMFIGNLPDRELSGEFYRDAVGEDVLEDHTAAIGVWRSKEEFADEAANAGWSAQFFKMPNEFYAAHYRYDVLLTPDA